MKMKEKNSETINLIKLKLCIINIGWSLQNLIFFVSIWNLKMVVVTGQI